MELPPRQAMERDRDCPDDPGQREDVHTSGSSSKPPPDQLEIFRAGDRQTVLKRTPTTTAYDAAQRNPEQSDTEKLLSAMHSLTQQQRKRLDACAGGLSGKLDELRELHARIEDLCNSAKELLQSFSNEDARFRAEFKTQIEGLERFKDEIVSIDALRDRLRVEQEKVADYERRIDKVQAKIEKQKEMEVGKKRVSWRMRLLWGFSAMVVILWLLATAGGDYEDTDNVADDEPIKLLPPALRADRELEFSLE